MEHLPPPIPKQKIDRLKGKRVRTRRMRLNYEANTNLQALERQYSVLVDEFKNRSLTQEEREKIQIKIEENISKQASLINKK